MDAVPPPGSPDTQGPQHSWLRRALTPVGTGETGGQPSTPEQRRQAFQILFLSLMCLGIGQAGMFTILPPIARELNMSASQMGFIFAVSATIWVFSSAFWGARSDHYGRRPMIILGLSAFALSTFAFATSIELGLLGWLPMAVFYPMMIASRSIYGVFGSAGFPAAQGYIADRTSATERTSALANLNAAFGLGSTIGPTVLAAFAVFGMLAPFYLVASMAAFSSFIIWRFLPERTAPVAKPKNKKALSWRDQRLLPFVVFGVLMGTAGSIPIQIISFFMMDVMKLDAVQVVHMGSYAVMASSVAALFAQFVVVQRLKLTAGQLVVGGITLSFLSYVLFSFAYDFGVVMLAMLLSGLGFGLIRPGYAALSSLAVGKDEQGAAAGITGGAGASGFIFAPLVGNKLYEFNTHWPFYFGAAIVIVMAIYAWATPRLRTLEVTPEDNADPVVPKV